MVALEASADRELDRSSEDRSSERHRKRIRHVNACTTARKHSMGNKTEYKGTDRSEIILIKDGPRMVFNRDASSSFERYLSEVF